MLARTRNRMNLSRLARTRTPSRGRELPCCPPCMLGYYWIHIACKLLQDGDKLLVSAVPHCDHGIWAQTGALWGTSRRTANLVTKPFRLNFGKPLQRGIHQSF